MSETFLVRPSRRPADPTGSVIMFTVIGTATVDLFVSNLAAMPRSEGDEFTVDSLVFHDEPLRTSLGGKRGQLGLCSCAPGLACGIGRGSGRRSSGRLDGGAAG